MEIYLTTVLRGSPKCVTNNLQLELRLKVVKWQLDEGKSIEEAAIHELKHPIKALAL